MGKFGPPQNQTNDTSFKRNELSENVIFIEMECVNQKVWSFK